MERTKVFAGSRFIFIRPGEREGLKGEVVRPAGSASEERIPVLFSEPTVVARHCQDLCLTGYPALTGTTMSVCHHLNVVTDRKLYRKNDSVHIFVFAPHFRGRPAEVKIFRNRHVIHTAAITLGSSGTFHDTLHYMADGSYSVSVEAGRTRACAAFTVAEYTLSFLQASLMSHVNDRGTLRFELLAMTNDIPFTGRLNVGLFCEFCNRVVEEAEIRAENGRAGGSLVLSSHSGAFSLVITTPEGDSATLAVPDTELFSRTGSDIVLSVVGEKHTAALMPREYGEKRERGLYIRRECSDDGFISLGSIVGKRLTAEVNVDLDHFVMCFYAPATDSFSQIERRRVKAGDKVEFDVPRPYAALTVGGIGKECHEAHAWLIHPAGMELSITAPDKARPGSEVEIAVSSNRKGMLMFVVADHRLDREDPLEKLAASTFLHMQRSPGYLRRGQAGEVLPVEPEDCRSFSRKPVELIKSAVKYLGSVIVGRRDASAGFDAMPGKQMAVSFSDSERSGRKPESVVQLMMASPSSGRAGLEKVKGAGMPLNLVEELNGELTSRLSFPEVVLAELVEFDGELRRKVVLGDQIGAFDAFAFLIDGDDFLSAKSVIETSKDAYVELDIPSLISEGDEIVGRAMVRCQGKGTVSVRSSVASVEMEVDGARCVKIPIRSAGEVMAELTCGALKDVTSRVIYRPGRETVTVSELRRLNPGESLEAERVVVYPNPAYLLESTVSSLIQYPFG